METGYGAFKSHGVFFMINNKRLINLTKNLLCINSENPPGNEARIAKFVAGFLTKYGYKPKIFSFSPDRDNVIAILRGKSKGRDNKPLLVTPHLDTVPAGLGWKHAPFKGEIYGGKIYGRGASDCKCNLAVAMEVFASMSEDGFIPESDVIFLATADEETGSGKGLKPFLNSRLADVNYALILDSDEFDIITAQKGLIHFKVSVKGKRAHGAYPERGENAIDKACILIQSLKKLKLNYKRHKLLKPPTINVGTIRGGDKVNMVADWCVFELDLRFLPGMNANRILASVRRVFDKCGIKYNIKVDDIQNPYEISQAHPLVSSLKKAAVGLAPECKIKGSEGATVITFFKKKNIPAVATGYGSKGTAHSTDEYARIDNICRGAVVLERFIKLFDERDSV